MAKTKDLPPQSDARFEAARGWIDREIAALQTRPLDALGQGRVGRLQRHLVRLDSMGEAYLPTVEAEMPASVSDT